MNQCSKRMKQVGHTVEVAVRFIGSAAWLASEAAAAATCVSRAGRWLGHTGVPQTRT